MESITLSTQANTQTNETQEQRNYRSDLKNFKEKLESIGGMREKVLKLPIDELKKDPTFQQAFTDAKLITPLNTKDAQTAFFEAVQEIVKARVKEDINKSISALQNTKYTSFTIDVASEEQGAKNIEHLKFLKEMGITYDKDKGLLLPDNTVYNGYYTDSTGRNVPFTQGQVKAIGEMLNQIDKLTPDVIQEIKKLERFVGDTAKPTEQITYNIMKRADAAGSTTCYIQETVAGKEGAAYKLEEKDGKIIAGEKITALGTDEKVATITPDQAVVAWNKHIEDMFKELENVKDMHERIKIVRDKYKIRINEGDGTFYFKHNTYGNIAGDLAESKLGFDKKYIRHHNVDSKIIYNLEKELSPKNKQEPNFSVALHGHVKYGLSAEFIDKGLASGKYLIGKLPSEDAKTMIHARMFSGNPNASECPFNSEKFKPVWEFLNDCKDNSALDGHDPTSNTQTDKVLSSMRKLRTTEYSKYNIAGTGSFLVVVEKQNDGNYALKSLSKNSAIMFKDVLDYFQ